jgi:hypothetical protein
LGKSVHLANYSFCDIQIASLLSENPIILREDWFNTVRGDDVTIWRFGNSGAVELEKNYRRLVDGGVDSLMRGDEERPGTPLEDTISLAAVEPLEILVTLPMNKYRGFCRTPVPTTYLMQHGCVPSGTPHVV